MIAVSNSSPLIHLSNINKFSLLNYFYEEVFIPKAVYDEVVVRGKGRPGTLKLNRISWLKVRAVEDTFAMNLLRNSLDPGEAEAIVLAKELKVDVLLIDELAARIIARSQGIEVMGTIGLLERAYLLGKIEDLRGIIDELRMKGFWVSERVYRELIGEDGS